MQTCLGRISSGRWVGSSWSWVAPKCCGIGPILPSSAAELLRGKSIAFVGDSQSRRHMWAVVDAVGGAARATRRRPGRVVPDSTAAFDRKAMRLNDSIYDSQRAYHAGQTVLLNVDTGRWTMLDPGELCGVDRRNWLADHRLIGALKRGSSPPWSVMRGAQFQLGFNVSVHGGAVVGLDDVRRAVQAAAARGMADWGCTKPRAQDCTYAGAVQRACARNLRVRTSRAWSGGAARVTVAMGDVGGACAEAARRLSHALFGSLQHPPGSQPQHPPPALDVRKRPTPPAPLPAEAARTLSRLSVVGGIRLEPWCRNYCRTTYHLECPSDGPTYAAAVRRALEARGHKLGLGAGASLKRPAGRRRAAAAPGNSSDLSGLSRSVAVLTFVYAQSVETEMVDTFERWHAHSYGHGADVIVLGATWQSVSPGAAVRRGGATILRWSDELGRSWHAALAACARAARCLVRTPLETPRQAEKGVHLEFNKQLRSIAAAARAHVVDGFEGTWDGVRSGLLAHHDSTRIHFSDTGRAFLAQLTLNAIALLARAQRP